MYNEGRRFSWLKLFIYGFIVLLIGFIIYGLVLYNGIQNSKTEGFTKTEEKVLAKTDITNINYVIRSHGEEFYHVVYGKTKKGTEEIAFVPMSDNKGKITTVSQSNIISEKAIQSQWENSCNSCELVRIVPSMIKNKPLWEITYWDKANRYIIDYLSMYDGSQFEQYRLKRIFK